MGKKQMTSEELMKKYGESMVEVVPGERILPYISDGFTCRKDAMVTVGAVAHPLISVINSCSFPMLRAKAELDPSVKQLVGYVIVQNKYGKIFTTKRVGGDARLVGGYSIGTGGHVDGGENIYDAVYRELKEEIGLEQANIFTNQFNGYIYNGSNEVNSVHLGLAFTVMVCDDSVIKCLEADKLVGEWLTVNELAKLRKDGKLESWSEILFDKVVADE